MTDTHLRASRNVVKLLKERGFIDSLTTEGFEEIADRPLKIYVGFDPTADSLHLGNLVGIVLLAWFQRCGHTPVAILGGATGRIGDPSGKSVERPFLDDETLKSNIQGIRKNLEAVLDMNHSTHKPLILNNNDWFKQIGFIDFLRDIGKLFRVGPMLSKEMVRTRLASEDGLSFTEFSYQVLQAYDFLHLFDQHEVSVQGGGSDQWGNITAGTELIRKMRGKTAHGITFPLITRSDGKKFGKSESGAVWLSPDKLSPYEFYQYIFRTPDADVPKLMRMLTFMEMEEIHHYEAMMGASDYIPNTIQKKLAEEITRIVHGAAGVEMALRVTAGAAPGAVTELNVQVLESLEMPKCTLPQGEVVGKKLMELFVSTGLVSSKGEAKRLIQNGGAYLNNYQIKDVEHVISSADLIEGKLLLLASGKKNKRLVRIE